MATMLKDRRFASPSQLVQELKDEWKRQGDMLGCVRVPWDLPYKLTTLSSTRECQFKATRFDAMEDPLHWNVKIGWGIELLDRYGSTVNSQGKYGLFMTLTLETDLLRWDDPNFEGLFREILSKSEVGAISILEKCFGPRAPKDSFNSLDVQKPLDLPSMPLSPPVKPKPEPPKPPEGATELELAIFNNLRSEW